MTIVCADTEINENVLIGSSCVIHPKCIIKCKKENTRIIIGEKCIIEEGCIIMNDSDYDMIIGKQNHFRLWSEFYGKSSGIGCVFEPKSVIKQNVVIGNNVNVGAECVINDNIRDNISATAIGKRVKSVEFNSGIHDLLIKHQEVVLNSCHQVKDGYLIRAYYDEKHIIVYDLLLSHSPYFIISCFSHPNSQTDEQLSIAIKEKIRDLNKLTGRLKLDGLLKVESRWEVVKNDYKKRGKISKTYYYIDYPHAVDVIKYRIFKIGKIIEKEVQDQMENLPYQCSNCKTEYNALDMLSLDTNDEKIPICGICSCELQLDEKGADTTETSEKFTKFMKETKPILDLLKMTDSIVIPETKLVYISNEEQLTDEQGLQISREQGASNQVFVEINETGPDSNMNSIDEDSYLQNYYANLHKNDNFESTTPSEIACKDENESEDDEEDFELVAVDSNSAIRIEATSQVTLNSTLEPEDDDEDEEFVQA